MQSTPRDSRASRPAKGLWLRFVRRNRFLLLFVTVLIFASVMVVRQFMKNQVAHFELREDFILLHDRGQVKACDRLYQSLIESLPDTSEKVLLDDLQRTSFLVTGKEPDPDNPVWRYHVSVKKELQRRSEQRLSRALELAERE